ncbi:MAG: antitoxin component YwqK of YwqJK toxin-antitoxin module [Flavobacteriaceae bacterium]|jgi:antitoxin component YwqK of YwqJK toxin-antitoxin module
MKSKSLVIRKKFLILLFAAGFLSVYSQVDSSDYKVFRYENGQVSSEGFMVNGVPNFMWKTYFENGVLKSDGNRLNFLLDSTWNFYDEIGNLRYVINYKEGKKNGEYINYKNDKISEIEIYKSDIKEGINFQYYPTGELKKEIPYVNGLRSGKGYEYSESQRIILILTYEKDYLKRVDKINRLDKIDRRQGVWKEFYDNKTVKWEGVYVDGEKYGLFKSFDEDGAVTSVENYKNGVLDTESPESVILEIKNEYFKGGKVKSSGSYKDGSKHGTHRDFDENGNIVKSFVYEDGIMVAEGIVDKKGNFSGPWKLYFPNGNIKAKGSYELGKRVEDWVFYHINGIKSQSGKYWKGKPTGNWQWYYNNSELRRDENYRKGLEEGESIEYDDTGSIIGQGEYLEGYKEGNWYIHSGDHKEIGVYIEGERDGEWIHEYDNGKLSFKGEYQRGLAIGKHKYFYNDGGTKEEGKYSSGVKNGVWKTYNINGDVILSIEYQSGIEIKLEGVKIKPSYKELDQE